VKLEVEPNLSSLGDRLTDKTFVLNTANKILKGMLFPQLPSVISERLYAGLILVHIENGVDKIFKYASSPIQKMFFSSIFLNALNKGIFFTTIMPPLHSATEQIENVRGNWRFTIEMWRNYQRQSGETTMDSFLYYINNLSGLGEDVIQRIQGGLELSILEYCKTYFLSLDSTFKDLKIQEHEVKTNILIWSLWKPDFMLFVECEEQDSYSDISTFSDDRARDRLIQSKGYQVLRFSSRELTDDLFRKAQELLNYLENRKLELNLQG
jgi:hypothetical protein